MINTKPKINNKIYIIKYGVFVFVPSPFPLRVSICVLFCSVSLFFSFVYFSFFFRLCCIFVIISVFFVTFLSLFFACLFHLIVRFLQVY